MSLLRQIWRVGHGATACRARLPQITEESDRFHVNLTRLCDLNCTFFVNGPLVILMS
jgi:hypothetical protein